jgi:UPF0755 protein
MFRWRALLSSMLLLAALAGAAAWWWLQQPLPLAKPAVELSVEPGTSVQRVAQGWVSAGVQVPSWLLYGWFRASGDSRKIRAGSYEVEPGITPRGLLAKMVKGDETLLQLRLIEGWNFRQVRDALAQAEGLKPLSAALSEAELMAQLGAPGVPAEGRFFPDTYAYSRGASDIAVLQRALRAMQRELDAAWAQRLPDSPLKSADDALTLASIVEKETGATADRGKVAAVFSNRLRIGMPLQTDPTVIYGLGASFDGNLRRRDLLADTPYNTYTRRGLPPTPIAMPGRASLRAALAPERINALYFVARGDGSSQFSGNLADHNRAVNQYQRGASPASP